MRVPPAAVAAEIIRQGGTVEQAWVGATLVTGIESNGDPTELAGGVGPAQGLFQFEPGTWLGNGGGKNGIPAKVGDATWQQQVTVFINASKGNNFHDWGPDLSANPGNPNDPHNPAYHYTGPPQPGSKVYNGISQLSAGGTMAFLGNVPNFGAGVDAGGAVPANPAPGPLGAAAGLVTGGTSVPNIPIVSWADALGTLLSDLISANWWKRVGLFSAGAVLVVAGVVLFVSTTKTGERVESDAIEGAVAA